MRRSAVLRAGVTTAAAFLLCVLLMPALAPLGAQAPESPTAPITLSRRSPVEILTADWLPYPPMPKPDKRVTLKIAYLAERDTTLVAGVVMLSSANKVKRGDDGGQEQLAFRFMTAGRTALVPPASVEVTYISGDEAVPAGTPEARATQQRVRGEWLVNGEAITANGVYRVLPRTVPGTSTVLVQRAFTTNVPTERFLALASASSLSLTAGHLSIQLDSTAHLGFIAIGAAMRPQYAAVGGATGGRSKNRPSGAPQRLDPALYTFPTLSFISRCGAIPKQPGETEPVLFLHINGILTFPNEARWNENAIAKLICDMGTIYHRTGDSAAFFYNPTGVLGNKYNSVAALFGSWLTAAMQENDQTILDKGEAGLQGILTAIRLPKPLPDAARFADSLLTYRQRGYRVVIVAHSQGNLMTQQALAAIERRDARNMNALCGIGVVAVAPPTSAGWPTVPKSIVMVKGARTKDVLLSWRVPLPHDHPTIRTALSDSLDATVDETVSAGELLHNFLDSYMGTSESRHAVNQALYQVTTEVRRASCSGTYAKQQPAGDPAMARPADSARVATTSTAPPSIGNVPSQTIPSATTMLAKVRGAWADVPTLGGTAYFRFEDGGQVTFYPADMTVPPMQARYAVDPSTSSVLLLPVNASNTRPWARLKITFVSADQVRLSVVQDDLRRFSPKEPQDFRRVTISDAARLEKERGRRAMNLNAIMGM